MDIDALRRLRAKVANGTARTARNTSDFTSAFPERHEHWDQDPVAHAAGAYFGSLDAAMALHEAMLPGWTCAIDMMPCEGGWETAVNLWNGRMAPHSREVVILADEADTPARAWLLAILDALIAEAAE